MSAKVRILLSAADQATEIMLVDAFLNRIQSGIGELDASVEPGIYKARFVSGSVMEDVLLDATRPGIEVRHHQEAPDLHTATPLPASRSTLAAAAPASGTPPVDAQMAAAEAMSFAVDRSFGYGSHLFVFVRDEDRTGAPDCLQDVTVLRLDGTVLATLADGQQDPASGSAGLSLELDPGTYRLRVASGPGGSYEWCITAVPGFQTQAFHRIEHFTFEKGSSRSPALRSASLLMVNGMGFQPHWPHMRLTELALLGLIRGRKVLPERVVPELLQHEMQNPLLGLFAAHMFLAEAQGRSRHRRVLGDILAYLQQVMPQHPDVLALELALAGRRARSTQQMDAPPLLSTSWDIVSQASATHPHLLAPGSPLERMAPYAIGSRPWLLFSSVDESRPRTEAGTASPTRALRELRALLQKDPEKWDRAVSRIAASGALNNLQRGVLGALGSAAYLKGALAGSKRMDMPDTTERAKALFDSINAPRAVKSSAISELARMLDEQTKADQ